MSLPAKLNSGDTPWVRLGTMGPSLAKGPPSALWGLLQDTPLGGFHSSCCLQQLTLTLKLEARSLRPK